MDRISRPIFDDAEAVAPGQRTRKRDSLFLTAQVALQGAPATFDARVRNLSAGGLMLETRVPFDDGIEVRLLLRGVGLVCGRVAWQAEGRVGISFDHPIDPQLARKPVGAGGSTPDYAKPILW